MDKKAEIRRETEGEKESMIGKRNPESPVNHLESAVGNPYLAENLIAPVVPETGGTFNFCIRSAPLLVPP